MRLSVCTVNTVIYSCSAAEQQWMLLKCNKWLLYWLTSGSVPAPWTRFGEIAIMNELTQFINQKNRTTGCGSVTVSLFIMFNLPLFNQVLLVDVDCIKIADHVPVFITSHIKCYNIVILYNPCWESLFLHAPLYREVRAPCRVQGSTGTSRAESLPCSRARKQGRFLHNCRDRLKPLFLFQHADSPRRYTDSAACTRVTSHHIFAVEINIDAHSVFWIVFIESNILSFSIPKASLSTY